MILGTRCFILRYPQTFIHTTMPKAAKKALTSTKDGVAASTKRKSKESQTSNKKQKTTKKTHSKANDDDTAYAISFVDRLDSEYKKHTNKKIAKQMSMYIRDLYPCYGIYTPQRRTISKMVEAEFDTPTAPQVRATLLEMWNREMRDFQMYGVDYAYKYRAALCGENVKSAKNGLDFVKVLLTTKSWWDTIDLLASKVVGYIVAQHRTECTAVMDQWIHDPDLWVRRSAILHQLNYNKQTDEPLLFRYCLLRCDEEDFFIRKAIGWALRNHYRIAPKAVKEFVVKNKDKLSELSKREALKHHKG